MEFPNFGSSAYSLVRVFVVEQSGPNVSSPVRGVEYSNPPIKLGLRVPDSIHDSMIGRVFLGCPVEPVGGITLRI